MHSASHSHSVHVHVHVFISSTYTCITVAVSQCPWLCDAALPTALVCMLLCFFHACCSKLHSPSSRCTLYMCTPPGNTSLYPSCLNISRTTARKGHSTCTCQLLFCFLHCLLCYMYCVSHSAEHPCHFWWASTPLSWTWVYTIHACLTTYMYMYVQWFLHGLGWHS